MNATTLSGWKKWLLWPADPGRPFSRLLFGVIVLATTAADQVSKLIAVQALKFSPPVIVIPNFFRFAYAENTGAAFSILEGHTGFLSLFSALIVVFISGWALMLKAPERGLRLPLGLIVGGALGNLYDRVKLGYVIDFIDVHWKNVYHYPTFNVADSAVCVGMALLLLAGFYPAPEARPEPAPGVASRQASR